jgi:hypothetical protein
MLDDTIVAWERRLSLQSPQAKNQNKDVPDASWRFWPVASSYW